MDTYNLVWEISNNEDSFQYGVIFRLIIGIVVLLLGIVLLIKKRKTHKDSPTTIFALYFIIFWGVIWTSIHSHLLFGDIRYEKSLTKIYTEKKYEVVEGIVTVLHKQPHSGHDKGDIIEIGGISFEVDYFVITPAYKTTIAYGGALREGVYARVKYYEGEILSIEIKE